MDIMLSAELILFAAMNFAIYVFPPIVIEVPRLHLREARGFAFSWFIFIRKPFDENALRHEMVHWEQQRRYTPAGIALFLGWHYAKCLLRGMPFRYAWESNPIEQEANKKMYDTAPIRKFWHINH